MWSHRGGPACGRTAPDRELQAAYSFVKAVIMALEAAEPPARHSTLTCCSGSSRMAAAQLAAGAPMASLCRCSRRRLFCRRWSWNTQHEVGYHCLLAPLQQYLNQNDLLVQRNQFGLPVLV